MSLIHILKNDEMVSMSIVRNFITALVLAGLFAVSAVQSEASEAEAESRVVTESQALASEGNCWMRSPYFATTSRHNPMP